MYALVLPILISCGCTSDDRINHNQRLSTFIDLPTNLSLVETHVFTIQNIPSLLTSNANLNGYTIAQIDEIISDRGIISASFSSANLSMIDDIAVRIYTTNKNEFKEMYYRDIIPFDQGKQMDLFSGLANLQQVLSNETFNMEIRVRLRSFVPPGTRLDLDFGYVVYLQP